MMWILVAIDLRSYGSSSTSSRLPPTPTLISTTAAISEVMSVIGLYGRDDIAVCIGYTTPAYRHLWVPCFAFDAILAVLSLWAAVRHLRQHSGLSRLNKPQLVDTLVQGNVIYFLWCVFSYPHRMGLKIGCSPLATFIAYLNSGVSQEVEEFANTLFRRAPIGISVGCRLILSVHEAASHQLTLGSHPVMSTFVVREGPREDDNNSAV